MVRHKTEIYLLRAEKIYNLHLSPEMNQIRDCVSKRELNFISNTINYERLSTRIYLQILVYINQIRCR